MQSVLKHIQLKKRRLVNWSEWVETLYNPEARVIPGAIFICNMRSNWHTQRPQDEVSWTHYLFYSKNSRMRITSDSKTIDVAPGSLVWFPPGIAYRLWLYPGKEHTTEPRLIRLRFQLIHNDAQITPWLQPAVFNDANFFSALTRQILSEYSQYDDCGDMRLRALLALLITDSIRTRTAPKPGLNNSQILRLANFLKQNFANHPTPATLARELQLSAPYFTRLFKQTTGTSPKRWIMEQRIDYICELLINSNMTIAEIASITGYKSHNLLSRQFKSILNISPTEYRQTF